MRSIKPGRGPSFLSGVVGIFMIGFGIFWTITAYKLNPTFSLFGVFWTCMAGAITIYNFKNAKKKNRFSAFDITDSEEEPDPLNERFSSFRDGRYYSTADGTDAVFCPYCGYRVESNFEFCPKCGRRLP